MQTATETRRPFDLYTVDDNGEYAERIATGIAYPDEVHRVAWSEAVNTGETVAIVWADRERGAREARALHGNGCSRRESGNVKGERFTATALQKASVLQQRLFR